MSVKGSLCFFQREEALEECLFTCYCKFHDKLTALKYVIYKKGVCYLLNGKNLHRGNNDIFIKVGLWPKGYV